MEPHRETGEGFPGEPFVLRVWNQEIDRLPAPCPFDREFAAERDERFSNTFERIAPELPVAGPRQPA